MAKQVVNDFSKGSIISNILRLSIPMTLAQLINVLYSIVDRIYIGRMGENSSLALTGVGVCLPIITIVIAFANLIGMGGAPLFSIKRGEGNEKEAEAILGNSVTLLVIFGLCLTVVGLIVKRPLLYLLGASENTIEYAVSYLNIYALGTLFVQLTLGMNAFVTAEGFTKVSMVSVAIGAILNIALDPIMIFGLNMGVRGAALATVISQAVSCIIVVAFLCSKKSILRLKRKNLNIKPKVVFPCIALGTAAFIMQASESVISVCFNSSLLKYGGDIAVGAMTILTSVMQFAMLPLQGIAQGAQPITSYNYGANNTERVKKTFRVLLTTSLIYSVILWLAVMLLPQFFVSIFTPETAMIEFASKALRIYMAVMLLFGIQIACQMTFTALGNATSSIIVAVTRKFILLLPLIYIMPHMVSDKTMGVYLAEPVADFIAVTFTAILFYFQFRKAMNKIES